MSLYQCSWHWQCYQKHGHHLYFNIASHIQKIQKQRFNVFIQVVFFSVTPVEIECRMISTGEFGQKELANLYFDILENEQKMKFVEKPKKNGLSRAVKVVILCLSWYTASSASNIINKIVYYKILLPIANIQYSSLQ